MLALKHDVKLLRSISCITISNRGSRCKKPIPEVGKTTYVYKNVPEYPHPEEFEKDEFLPRKLSYWPEGIGQLRPKRTGVAPWAWATEYITVHRPPDEILPEYTETPMYPEIDDYRVSGKSAEDERRSRRKWYKEIQELPTFEQKMLEIVDIKAHQCVKLTAWSHMYDNLPMFKRLTNTQVINSLPYDYHGEVSGQQTVKVSIMDALSLHLNEANEKRHGTEARKKANNSSFKPAALKVENLVEDIFATCIKNLTPSCLHLQSSQIDFKPDIRSFWYVNGLPTPSKHIRYRRQETIDQVIQYNDSAILNIRSKDPLPSINNNESGKDYQTAAAEYNYHPKFLGYSLKWLYPQCLPGFWPNGEENSFPFLSVYSRENLNLRKSLVNPVFTDEEDATVGMGLMSSFGWLNAIAGVHGFTPYDELTYPFTTQTIVTDGQHWNFFVYQLNNHTYHSDFVSPTAKNVCWSSGTMKLFDKFENDVFHGVNDSVLNNIVMFLEKKTEANSDSQLKPYLGVDNRTEEEKAKEFEKLTRRYGQYRSYMENLMLARSKVPQYEHIFERPKYAPSTQHWRKPWRYYNAIRNNRNKFTV